VQNRDLTDAEGAAFLWMVARHNTKLKELSLARNGIGAKTAAALAQFMRFNTSLTAIDLHENALGDAGASLLAKALSFNATVKTLRLSRNEISSAAVPQLVDGVVSNHELQHICMEVSGGTMSPGIHLPSLKGIVPADQIDLSSRSFGPLSVMIVAKLFDKYRPQVTTLGLDRNPILAEGATAVAEMLKQSDDLVVLDLRFCALGAEGMAVIADALRMNTSIETCLALKNDIGPEGAKAVESMLAYNSTLRVVDIQDNLVPPDQKKSLTEAARKRTSALELRV